MGKVSAIFVGGAMDERHWRELEPAAGQYPPGTNFFTYTPAPDRVLKQNLSSRTVAGRSTSDQFLWALPTVLRNHGRGDLLTFVQFGHGKQGPALVLSDRRFYANELVDLFANNIDPANRPTTAIILGGCYSGGFANHFLRSNFQPDFFFGASPPFTVARQAIPGFFAANATDRNADGVVTLRERAVHEMNEGNNPLAVMFSRRGSPDVDLANRPALKPYFPKAVERLKDYDALIASIKSLSSGEQAVVLVSGTEGVPKELLEWFEKEGREGDGFYKFLIVNDYPEGRGFFQTQNGPKIFAMGPNLRYHGVPLEPFKPIGDQIPAVLADENPLLVLGSWGSSIFTPWKDSYKRRLYRNLLASRELLHRDLIEKIEPLLSSEKVEEQMNGLNLLRILAKATPGYFIDLEPIIARYITRLLEGSQLPPWEILVGIITLPLQEEKRRTLMVFVSENYDEKLAEGVEAYFKSIQRFAKAWAPLGENRGVNEIASDLVFLGASCIEVGGEGLRFLREVGLVDTKHPGLRRASAFYLAQVSPDYRSLRDVLVKQWDKENDLETKVYLLKYLTGRIDYESNAREFYAATEKLIEDKETPKVLKDAAKEYLEAVYKAEQKLEPGERKAITQAKAKILNTRQGDQFQGISLLGRWNNGVWTGGLTFLNAHMDVWYQRLWVKDDLERMAGFSAMLGLNAAVHYKDDWLTLYPTISPAFNWEWERNQEGRPHKFNKRISLSAGYALRYMPVRDWKGADHGVTVAVEWKDRHEFSAPKGNMLRFLYFPPQDNASSGDYIFTLGATFE